MRLVSAPKGEAKQEKQLEGCVLDARQGLVVVLRKVPAGTGRHIPDKDGASLDGAVGAATDRTPRHVKGPRGGLVTVQGVGESVEIGAGRRR